MQFLISRVTVIAHYLAERARYGLPEWVETTGRETLVVLDGVGGFQIATTLVRRALREQAAGISTMLYYWQFGLTGEIWTDLMWYRRNRLMGARLARRLLTLRRAHPDAVIHMLAYSGGAGIGVFACEHLRGRPIVDTLILACPAISPTYNLAPALSAVKRCYALVSPRDRMILGMGTSLFGTTDRKHCAAAGKVGFRLPRNPRADELEKYDRLREICWSPSLKELGHTGGHTGWVTLRLLKCHLLDLLRGQPSLPVRRIQQEA